MPDWKPTPLQARFVQEYLKDLNGTQAVIRSGYSETGAAVTANRLLTNPNIMALVEKGRLSIAKRNDVTVDRIVQEYARIAFADIRDVVNIHRGQVVVTDTATLTPAQAAAIGEIAQTKDGIRIKLNSKQAALDSLSRTMGMFRDKLEHSGDVTLRTLADVAKEAAGR